jgi:uncharacterized protein (DUF427 family)
MSRAAAPRETFAPSTAGGDALEVCGIISPMKKAVPGPGRGSVWEYPCPPQVEPCLQRLSVEFNGETLADTSRAHRVLETSHPPTYYIPQFDVKAELLKPNATRSFCEYKGEARYWDIHASARTSIAAARSYRSPNQPLSALRNHLAFHPHRFDGCFVDGERVEPQEGDFYGRWITSDIAGTAKGGPATRGW